MRLTNVLSGRLEFYDRNAIPTTNYSINQNIGPHALATRFTYTVPSGRSARIEKHYGRFRVKTVWTTPGEVDHEIFARQGPTFRALCFSFRTTANVVENEQHSDGAGTVQLLPGDFISGDDSDGGIGGTRDYYYSFSGMEFDT